MYRISVTTIEKFRRYMTEASSFDTEEALIESIKGLFKGNDKTKFGGAYHEIIEGKYQQVGGRVMVGDFNFSFDQAKPALDYCAAHHLAIPEVSVRKVYDTAFGPIQVTGRVDALEGIVIRDSKTRFSNYHVLDYMDSVQWKFYLDMMDLDTFFYDIFQVKGFDQLPHEPPYTVEALIMEPEEIRCERFAGMTDHINSMLHHFMLYLESRDLFGALKPAIEEELTF